MPSRPSIFTPRLPYLPRFIAAIFCYMVLTLDMGLLVGCSLYADHQILAAPWLDHRPGGRPPDQELVEYAVDFEIFAKQELRGWKPWKTYPTWRASWHAEYQQIRKRYSANPERAQEVIECAHYVLQRAGLPTYDP